MHLRDSDLRRNLRLGHLLEEAELYDLPLTRVQGIEPGGDERAVLDLLVAGPSSTLSGRSGRLAGRALIWCCSRR